MKICKIEDLKGDEILKKPILTDSYQVLLGEGTKLIPDYIERLKCLGIKLVYIEDDEDRSGGQIEILKRNVAAFCKEKVKKVLEHHTYSNNDELKELTETADNIITNILSDENVVEQVYDIKERSADLYEHALSICTLSTLTALKLKLSKEEVHNIGVACLLHDIGLRYLTINYENQSLDELPELEKAEFMKHPIYAYSSLKNATWISEEAKNMILSHHEKMDGSGYPLRSRNLSTAVRIISICDTFDEMICGIGCERKKVYEAIEYLKSFKNSKFDGKILNVFLQFTAVYPAGSCVITSEGETAIIMRQNKSNPDRPVIRIIRDKFGTAVSNDIIVDLSVRTDLFIEKPTEK